MIRIAAVAGVFLIALLGAWGAGNRHGVTARDAYYQPIISEMNLRSAEQIAANSALESLAQSERSESEKAYAELEKSLDGRLAAAESRLVAKLRKQASASKCPVSGASGASDSFEEATGNGASLEDRESAVRDLVGTARDCEDTAARLIEMQAWYELQRSRFQKASN